MRQCFELAGNGAGRVSPNPLVGAVLVKSGRIIGQGYHRAYGQPHAEIEALKACRESVVGATLYCNLEPCCHTAKQTPPCAPEIIRRGVKRLVVANIDPNLQVAGLGLQMLREAGVEVKSGLLEEEGRYLNRFFFTFMEKKRPFVLVKIAQTLNGMIATNRGERTAITGKAALKQVHSLRAGMDAVLVGAGTVNADNPVLTVRLVEGRHPRRLVLDGRLNSRTDAALYRDEYQSLTTILAGTSALREKRNLYPPDLNIVEFPEFGNGEIDLTELMKYLHEQNILSLLVEGGQEVFSRFINQKLFDELWVYQSPRILGRGLPALRIKKDIRLNRIGCEPAGSDIKLLYRPVEE